MIPDTLRSKAVSELMDEISDSMASEGHDLPEEMILAAAEKHLNDMVKHSTAALEAGQQPPIIKEALMVQGISGNIADELIAALTN